MHSSPCITVLQVVTDYPPSIFIKNVMLKRCCQCGNLWSINQVEPPFIYNKKKQVTGNAKGFYLKYFTGEKKLFQNIEEITREENNVEVAQEVP